MVVPWWFDKNISFPFHIKPRLDLNQLPYLAHPLREEESTTFLCFCWKSDALRITNVIPQQGYVVGDHIPFSLELNNDSNVACTKATVKLIECVTYHAETPYRTSNTTYRTLMEHEFMDDAMHKSSKIVMPQQHKLLSTEIFLDPSYDFKIFSGSEIVTVKYVLEAVAHVSGWRKSLTNTSEIVIGSEPFREIKPLPNGNAGALITEQPLPSFDKTNTEL